MVEETIRELTGEVKPIPAGQSAEQKIITIPFAGTIRSVSYTPNEALHVGQQGTGHPLRIIELCLRSPQGYLSPLATLDHRRIMLYPKQEQPLDLGRPEGGVREVVRGDELFWRSESASELWEGEAARDTGQRDAGDPGGIVKVVVAPAAWLWET